MREALIGLSQAGYDVTDFDLYQEQWNPVLDRHEFRIVSGEYFKPQHEHMRAARESSHAPDVQRHLDAVMDSDLLVLSFPLWWFSVPAILKGWLDRVFVMGAVFGGESYGLFKEAALVGRRAVLLITVGGSADSYSPSRGAGNLPALLLHIDHSLRFVGYDVIEPVVSWGPVRQSDDERRATLTAVREAFDNIDARSMAHFDPI